MPPACAQTRRRPAPGRALPARPAPTRAPSARRPAAPPLLLMGVRCTAAGLLLLAWSAARRERATSAEWGHAAVAGALMIGVTYGALAWAEQRLASGIAALLSATSPLWLTTLQWREVGRPGARTILGLLLGLAGVAVLVGAGTVSEVNPEAAAVLIV